ncbi:hypothetical protein LUZ63_002551 [Rhynchospora breviuscula]|uniref:non-specific serine/threonine protein kinase n=1 Tax=Rhynchospora breviuscula TaxID=2022672 RepID=A0A9Q0D001_9POAL|nr:hypothetical protein LUZ63_002551 [Rhynchospora breviuscula]
MSSNSTSSPPPANSSSNSTASSPPPTTVTPASPPPSSTSPTPPTNASPPPSSSPPSPPTSPPPTSSQGNTQFSPSPPPPPNSDSSQSSSSFSPAPPPPPPPPPPPGAVASPTSNNSSNTSGSATSGTSVILPVVLGVAGGIVLMLILSWMVNLCCRKKKKKIDKPHNAMQYYNDTSGFQGGNYFMSGPDSQWQLESNIGRPPLPISNTGAGGGGGWHPPPPPPMAASSDMSSATYSGPHVPPMPPPSPTVALGFNKSTFTYEELASATNNFSQANLLGQGGFGYVHKGVLPNGKEIAVKQLKSGSGQGEREFQAEVDIISRVHHRHLVSLVGYCIAGAQRMLVYEFVPNKTLEYHLHGASKGLSVMNWSTRLKIALGAAKGLAYLHEDCHPRIIHRDIKSANILIDNKFEAMVADFGLAKLTNDNHTHVSTRVMGTFGYLAPEYASSGKLTEKSDVFSYGVMLLEMITGRRPVDSNHTFMDDSLVDWARPLLSRALADGNYDELADPRLEGNYDPMELARMVASGAACVRHSAKRRPKMSQIVRALEGDVSLEDLNEGVRPGQSGRWPPSSSSDDYESSSYANKMRRIRKMALASPEYSGEYSGTVNDYDTRHSDLSSDAGFSGELNPRHRIHPDL